ncbi:PIN domain-containing protein [Fibrella arboris]|uniref:PIN domain-containing protein n=1 Tax=Fibrella arboris TaxID=3242486 RepID=UPI003521842F
MRLNTSISLVFSRIQFINENLIAEEFWQEAQELVADIDDAEFVALTIQLGASLWTGDKPLYTGLQERGFANVLTTDMLWQLTLGS